MGHPVVHFEVIGRDGPKLVDYYGALFDWRIDASNPMGYGVVAREENLNGDGIGIGGGVGQAPGDYEGHLTFYVEVPDVETTLARAEELGGTRLMGPDEVPGMGLILGQFHDPEGHLVGVIQSGT